MFLMSWRCRPQSTEDLEQAAPTPAPATEGQTAPDQAPLAEGEGHAGATHAEHAEGAEEQLGGGEQRSSGADPGASSSLDASGMEMGPMFGAEAGTAGGAGTAKGPVDEGDDDIEEIARPPGEEEVRPQRIWVARQRHN